MDSDLRKQAEAFINANPIETPTLSTVEVQKLFRELDVKQVELVMQNEAMQKSIAELEAARDAYASLYDAAPVGYLTVDRCSSIIRANPAAAEMLGYDRKDLINRRFSDFVHQDHRDSWLQHCHEVLAGNRDHAVDMQLIRSNSTTFTAQLICRPRVGDSPESWRCLEILVDITDLKKAEEALRESQELLQTVIDHITASVSLIRGSDLRLELINPAYQAIAPGKEMLGKTLDEIWPETGQDFTAICRRVLETGEPYEVHDDRNRIRRRSDGPLEDACFSWSLHRIRLPNNGKWGLLNTSWDTTESMQASRQLSADLEAMNLLQDVGTLFVREGNLKPVLVAIVDAAIAIAGADFGNCQLLDPITVDLKIMAQRGFPDWWLEYWDSVSKARGACGTALERCERVIVEDVEKSSIFKGSPALDIQLRAGVRAVQSTPLIGRSGKPLGMLSTHFKTPHQPDERTLRLLDLLALQASDIIERSQAEAALKDSENRYRGIFEQAADAIVLFDPQTLEILDCNEEAYRRLGYTREEFTNLSFSDFEVVETDAEVVERCSTIGKEGATVFETKHRTKTGDLLDIEIHAKTIDMGGRPLIMGIWRDITENKLAEKLLKESETKLALLAHKLEQRVQQRTAELQESEERFRTLFEESPDACFLIDLEGRYVEGNRETERQIGFPNEEMVGKSVFESPIFPPAAHEAARKRMQRLAEGEQLEPAEYDLRRKDGSRFTVEVTSMLVQINGNPVILCSSRDLTTRKQAEAERALMNSKLQLALDAAQMGWWRYDPQTKIATYDQRCTEIFGISPHDRTSGEINKMLHPDDRERILTLVAAALDPSSPQSYHAEYRIIRPDGVLRWIESHGLAIFEGEGEDRHAVDFTGTAADITERHQLREALEKRVLALTQPLNQSESITFEDLFDLQQMQNIQDEFSSAMGVASIITRPDGTPITEASNFTDFCWNVIRKTEKGYANCMRSDAFLGRHHPEGPVIQPCLSSGLWDAGTSISVGGRHIANWLIGQVRDETQTDEQIRDYAQEIGADEAACLEAFHRVPVMSRARFESVAQALFLLSNQLSTSAYQNVQQARFIEGQKKAEKALRESEEKYRSLFHNLAEEVQLWRLVRDDAGAIKTWRLVDVNPAGLQSWAKTREETIGKTADEIFPDATKHFMPIVQRIFADGRPYAWESYFPALDQHLKMTSVPFGDCFITTGFDITEIRKSEQILRESEERYRRLFETESDAIIIIDNETRRFVDVNDAAVRLYGYSREEFLSMSYEKVTVEPEASDKTIHALLKGQLSSVASRFHRKKNGDVIAVDISGATFKWKGRMLVCGICRDISERVAHEKELQKNQEELRHLASELSLAEQRERQRIAGELHDGVSQLLSSAYLRLDALGIKEKGGEREEALAKVSDIISQAMGLTRSLTFDLSCPMLYELGLGAALEDLCAAMSNEYAIRFNYSGDRQPLLMPLDRQMMLYRATRELVINVMKHSEAHTAWVRLDRLDNSIRICVSDDGKGFDTAGAGQGFSPEGGFGLFNIREYIQHVGGSLSLKSEPNNGCEIILSIPLEA